MTVGGSRHTSVVFLGRAFVSPLREVLRGVVAPLVDCEIPSSSIKTAASSYRDTKQRPTIRKGVGYLRWLSRNRLD